MSIVLTVSFITLGFVIGYLGQNSRMCFIGGFRDFLIVRDTGLLEGLFSFLAATWFLIFIFRLTGLVQTDYPAITVIIASKFGLISLGGGFIIGLVSTFSGACPMRHHVLFGQGRIDSGFYFIGFYGGVVVYYTVIVTLFKNIF